MCDDFCTVESVEYIKSWQGVHATELLEAMEKWQENDTGEVGRHFM